MESLYIVGGRAKADAHLKPEWHRFERAVILRLDLHTGGCETCVEYETPPDARPSDDPSIVFKAATVRGRKLYACTQTELLIYALPKFDQLAYLSLPWFNDIHHVSPTSSGTLLVANTGLDMVLELTPDGRVLREWNVLGEDPWARFSRDVDYRKVTTTKPHSAHPNYVFQLNDEIWVTRARQRDAICLTNPARRIPIDLEQPHDGIVSNGSVYYTTVDGHVVIADFASGRQERIVDLNEISGNGGGSLGWCRGLKLLDDGRLIVGFSRLRPTRWRENVRWVKRQLGVPAGSLPTRVAVYDIERRRLCLERTIERFGMSAIFSIHAADE